MLPPRLPQSLLVIFQYCTATADHKRMPKKFIFGCNHFFLFRSLPLSKLVSVCLMFFFFSWVTFFSRRNNKIATPRGRFSASPHPFECTLTVQTQKQNIKALDFRSNYLKDNSENPRNFLSSALLEAKMERES